MNYMEKVAQILEVELGEEFNIYGCDRIYKLTKYGVFGFDDYNQVWLQDTVSLEAILCGREVIIRKPILDETEREHLSNIIKPFRDKLKSIIRLDYYYKSKYNYIQVEYDRDLEQIILKSDTMYNNMKLGKEYSLEELGL